MLCSGWLFVWGVFSPIFVICFTTAGKLFLSCLSTSMFMMKSIPFFSLENPRLDTRLNFFFMALLNVLQVICCYVSVSAHFMSYFSSTKASEPHVQRTHRQYGDVTRRGLQGESTTTVFHVVHNQKWHPLRSTLFR